jgi:hypothetical protein
MHISIIPLFFSHLPGSHQLSAYSLQAGWPAGAI